MVPFFFSPWFLQNSGAGGASDLTSLVKAVVAGSVAGTSAGSSGNKDSYGGQAAYGAGNSYVSFKTLRFHSLETLLSPCPRCKFKSCAYQSHTTRSLLHAASQLFSLMHRPRTPRSAPPSMTSLTRY